VFRSLALRLRRLATWEKCLALFAATNVLLLPGAQVILGRIPKRTLELALGALVLIAFATHPVVSAARRKISPRSWHAVLAWLALIIATDALQPSPGLLYPFVRWQMFTGAVGRLPEPIQFRYSARYADGKSERLMPGAPVSDSVVSHLDGELKRELNELVANPKDRAGRARVAAAVRGVARIQELVEPERPIRAVAIERCRMPVQPPYEPECIPVFEFPGPSP